MCDSFKTIFQLFAIQMKLIDELNCEVYVSGEISLGNNFSLFVYCKPSMCFVFDLKSSMSFISTFYRAKIYYVYNDIDKRKTEKLWF